MSEGVYSFSSQPMAAHAVEVRVQEWLATLYLQQRANGSIPNACELLAQLPFSLLSSPGSPTPGLVQPTADRSSHLN